MQKRVSGFLVFAVGAALFLWAFSLWGDKKSAPDTPQVPEAITPFSIGYGYQGLDELQRGLYEKIHGQVEAGIEEMRLDWEGKAAFLQVMQAYFHDNPSHFWARSYTYQLFGDRVISLRFVFDRSKEQIFQDKVLFQKEVAKGKAEVESKLQGQTAYDISLGVHDYLIGRTTYGKDGTLDCYSAFGVFGKGLAVCGGYARSYQVLMEEFGIPTYYVVGESRKESHAWNMVQLGGDFYHVDVTWDDGGDETKKEVGYYYLHLSDEEIERDHTVDKVENLPLPGAAGRAENYHVKNGYYITDLGGEKEKIHSIVAAQMDKGAKEVTLKFQYKRDFDSFFKGDIYPYLKGGLARSAKGGSLGREFYYEYNQQQQTVVIFYTLGA